MTSILEKKNTPEFSLLHSPNFFFSHSLYFLILSLLQPCSFRTLTENSYNCANLQKGCEFTESSPLDYLLLKFKLHLPVVECLQEVVILQMFQTTVFSENKILESIQTKKKKNVQLISQSFTSYARLKFRVLKQVIRSLFFENSFLKFQLLHLEIQRADQLYILVGTYQLMSKLSAKRENNNIGIIIKYTGVTKLYILLEFGTKSFGAMSLVLLPSLYLFLSVTTASLYSSLFPFPVPFLLPSTLHSRCCLTF